MKEDLPASSSVTVAPDGVDSTRTPTSATAFSGAPIAAAVRGSAPQGGDPAAVAAGVRLARFDAFAGRPPCGGANSRSSWESRSSGLTPARSIRLLTALDSILAMGDLAKVQRMDQIHQVTSRGVMAGRDGGWRLR